MQGLEQEALLPKPNCEILSGDRACEKSFENGGLGFGIDALDVRRIEAEIGIVELQRQHAIIKAELELAHGAVVVGKAGVDAQSRSESAIRAPLQTATTCCAGHATLNMEGRPTSHFVKTFANSSLSRQACVPITPALIVPSEFAQHWGTHTHCNDEVQKSIYQSRCETWKNAKDKHSLQGLREMDMQVASALEIDMQVLEGKSFNSSRQQHAITMSMELENVSSITRSDRIRILETLLSESGEHESHLAQNRNCENPHVASALQDCNRHPGANEFSQMLHRQALQRPQASKRKALSARRLEREEKDINTDSRTFTCLSEIAQIVASRQLDSDSLCRLSRTLELRAYELRPNDALRAIALISEGHHQLSNAAHEHARQCTSGDHRAVICTQRIIDSLRMSAQKIMAAISSQLQQGLWEQKLHNAGQWGTPRFCADALMTMAVTKCGRQEQLDSLLAQLLLLLQRDAVAFTPPILATLARALAKIQTDGGVHGCILSVRSGTDALHVTANLRFLDAFNGCLVRRMLHFTKEEAADVARYSSQCLEADEQKLFSCVAISN